MGRATDDIEIKDRYYLVGARILLANDEIADGSLTIKDGFIRDICPTSAPSGWPEINLTGNRLMPGLIDLHSDAIEHEVEPRRKTFLPFDFAVRQADRLFATVGITTAYHSLSFWGEEEGLRSNEFNAEFSRQIVRIGERALIDNRVHARYEITNASGLPHILDLIDDGTASLVSIMDHTPGQGQYPEEQSFRDYCLSTGMTDAEIDEVLLAKKAASLVSGPSVEALCAKVLAHGIPFASHDDDLPERFPEHVSRGISIAEFPMNFASSHAARAHGFTVLVGSPNVLRGQSTGSGPKALELIEHAGANALCSDYVPGTILPSLFKIAETLGWPLWKAAHLGTLNPANGARLVDRGEICPGKRADLIEVELDRGWPVVRRLWSRGRLNYQAYGA